MQNFGFDIADVDLSIEFPDSLLSYIKILFPEFQKSSNQARIKFSVTEKDNGLYEILENERILGKNLEINQCALGLMNEVVRAIAENCRTHVAVHAASVAKGDVAIILPAQTGAGKTSLAAWLTMQGYEYLTDELVLLNGGEVSTFYRPLNIKSDGIETLAPLADQFDKQRQIRTDSVTIWPADFLGRQVSKTQSIKVGLFVFPAYNKNIDLIIEPLSPAQIGMELMACNVNARNIQGHGFKQIASIARKVPGLRLSYGEFEQLADVLPKLIDIILSGSIDTKFLNKVLKASPVRDKKQLTTVNSQTVPVATAKSTKKKLCIGMATYDDYDGVYFSAQAVRMYHPEVSDDTEILVLDNHPAGKCAKDLKMLDGKIKNYRYLPIIEKTGTAIRNMIFKNANAQYVLCIDCHVFIEPGAIDKLIAYFESNPQSLDLLQGPMYSDDLANLSTHFNPIWNKGMYGVWGFDERASSPDSSPFEIQMQGLGLFACRKDSWPGFNNDFRGFGGEEGYIHEKFRQAGGKTLCLPFLRWIHRFARPMGVPYPINWPDRIRNYLIGFTELGLDTQPIIEHFIQHLGEDATLRAVKAFEIEFNQSA